jgi:MFS family permease
MSTTTTATSKQTIIEHVSWLPLIVIVLAQLQMAFNVNALPVSIGPIAADLDAPATAISTALVYYSLFVAAFVMLGAKLGKIIGERRVFQIAALVHGASMAWMAVATDTASMNYAQILSGVAAAALVPTLVVLIAASYQGKQQAQAFGILASIPAVASGIAFIVAGYIATALSWRYSFGLLAILSIVVFILSFRLTKVPRTTGLKIDFIGVILSAAAIAFILIGFNNLNYWGFLWATPNAPFNLLGLSPVPFFIIFGIVLGHSFFRWSHRRVAAKKTPLLALEVLDSSEEKNTVLAFLVAGALGTAVSFLIPLYIQFVQGQTPLFTSVAIVPYTLVVALAAILSVRLYDRFVPRVLGIICFILVAAGSVFVGFSIANEWGTPLVILGLLILGLGEGTMLTLLFNVLVSSSPKKFAGDVGALRGVANNVSSALGAAFAGVVAVGLLGVVVTSLFNQSGLPQSLRTEFNFDAVDFVTNAQLKERLGETSVTSEQVAEAIRINEEARLRSLRATFILIAAVSLLALFPAAGLPKYAPGSVSAEEVVKEETLDFQDSKTANAA